MEERIGRKVRIILVGGFHYSGEIISENEFSITILDKYNAEVSLNKSSIEVLEVSSNGN
ncbi:MAG: hypothetical protein KJ566_00860 [Nanoarchaeota archaeon]|nr:hypothetical protein [Nanoarchaeota archaeon]